MTLRRGHGNGAGVPRIEVRPADEQAAPVAAQAVPLARRSNGTIADTTTARHLGAKGGRAKRERQMLTSALGLSDLAADAAFAPYRTAGDAFVREHAARLAEQAGGEVGPGPMSIVASAGVQIAASRFFSDKAAETADASMFTLASSLANASRQNLLAAYELAVREGQARSKAKPAATPWMEQETGE
jgi:hypothetical protein